MSTKAIISQVTSRHAPLPGHQSTPTCGTCPCRQQKNETSTMRTMLASEHTGQTQCLAWSPTPSRHSTANPKTNTAVTLLHQWPGMKSTRTRWQSKSTGQMPFLVLLTQVPATCKEGKEEDTQRQWKVTKHHPHLQLLSPPWRAPRSTSLIISTAGTPRSYKYHPQHPSPHNTQRRAHHSVSLVTSTVGTQRHYKST